jgi:hypothetical protein
MISCRPAADAALIPAAPASRLPSLLPMLLLQEYYKNGSVFDIIRKAELELGDMSGPALQSAAQTVGGGARSPQGGGGIG